MRENGGGDRKAGSHHVCIRGKAREGRLAGRVLDPVLRKETSVRVSGALEPKQAFRGAAVLP